MTVLCEKDVFASHVLWLNPRLTADAPLVYLDDLPEKSYFGRQELGKHGNDTSPGNGARRTVGGRSPQHGLMMHPTGGLLAEAIYDLSKKYDTLSFEIGRTDDTVRRHPLHAEILGDGKPLWKSQPLVVAGKTQAASVSVLGVNELSLKIIADTDTMSARVLWLNPRLLPVKPGPISVSQPPALEFDTGASVELPAFDLDPTQPLTIEGWGTFRKPAADAKDPLIVALDFVRLRIASDGHWLVSFNTHSGVSKTRIFRSDRPLKADRRTHFAVVWQGDRLAIYIDGQRQQMQPTFAASRSPQPFYALGKTPAAPGFQGELHGVRISRTARYSEATFQPAEELDADSDTLALYRFEEARLRAPSGFASMAPHAFPSLSPSSSRSPRRITNGRRRKIWGRR